MFLSVEKTGAVWMDRVFPNWELVIDTDRLDLASDTKCILGQLFGSFKRGCKQLGITLEQAADLGFGEHASASIWTQEVERRMPAFA